MATRKANKRTARKAKEYNKNKTQSGRATIGLYAVHWLDARFELDPNRYTLEPVLALTFGFVVKKTDKEIVVAAELFDDGSYRQSTAIPRGMVQRLEKVKALFKLPPKFTGVAKIE